MRSVFTFLFIALSIFCWAQNDVDITISIDQDSIGKKKRGINDSIRHTFVKSYPDHFFVWPVIKRRTLEVEARSIADSDHRVFFKPNNTVSLGFGFYLLEIAFELAFAVPIEEQSKFKYGNTDASDFQLNALGKYWGFDVYRQKYQRF